MGEEVIKKKRGNPNWVKGVKRNGQDMSKQEQQSTNNNITMAEEEVKQIPEKTETTTENGKANIPLDIFSDEIPKEELLPLDEEVKENPYAAIPESADQSSSTEAPSGESKEPSASTTTPSDSIQTSTQTSLSPEQKKNRAEKTVNLMFKGYEQLHAFGRGFAKVKEGELLELQMTGKLNPELQVPVGKGKLNSNEFFEKYNETIENNIIVTDDFKDAVRDDLIEISTERGWLISKELNVALIVGQDLATKAGMLIGLKQSANLVLKAFIEMTKNQNKKNQQEHPEPVESTTEMPETKDSDWKEEPPATS